MKTKLLAFDIDGTLVDRESRLPDENRDALAAAQAAGLEVMLVTGRSWWGTKELYRTLNLTSPAICYLGALVVDGLTERVLNHRALATEAWEAVRNLALQHRLPITACYGVRQPEGDVSVECDLYAADSAYATCRADDFATWDAWNPYSEMAPGLEPCRINPTLVAIYGDRAVRKVLETYPNGLPESQFDLDDRLPGETVLHIWHAEVDKGLALAAYCRDRGIQPDEVAAFGDAQADLSMLRYAGLRVVVPEGDPVAQEEATWVATPAEAIRRILEERA